MNDVKTRLCIGASGAVGAVMAVLAELMQKKDASAVLRMGDTLYNTFDLPYARVAGMFLIIALAVAVCFIFQCETPKSAFYRGASILTILMAVVPYNVPPSVNTDPNAPAASPPAAQGRLWQDLLQPEAAFAQSRAPAPGAASLTVVLTTSDGKPVRQATVSLADPRSKEVVARSKLSGNRLYLYPAAGRYLLSVEVEGYGIVQREVSLQAGRPTEVRVALKSTWTPLPLQRLFRKY